MVHVSGDSDVLRVRVVASESESEEVDIFSRVT